MYNRVTICGRIANDLDLKETDTGRLYLKFSLAVNNIYNKTTDFVPVTIWNQTAQNVSRFLKKGSLILIEGMIQVRTVGPEDNRRTYFNVSGNRVIFLDSKGKKDADSAPTKTEKTFSNTNLENHSEKPPATPQESSLPKETNHSSEETPSSNQKNSTDADSKKEEEGIYWSEE